MKLLILCAVLLSMAGSVSAQSFFSSVPKPAVIKKSAFTRSVVAAPVQDSTLNAFRATSAGAYGVPGNIAMAGVGVSYQHMKYDFTNVRWQTQWSVGAYGFAGGSVAPKSPSDIITGAVLVGFYNDLIRVGPGINMNGNLMGVISVGINFNN